MTDYYQTLGIEPGAKQEAIQAAYEEQLASRRSRRQKNGDVHQAIGVLGDPVLRAAYDLKRTGSAVSERLSSARESAVDTVSSVISEIDVAEVARQAREVGLKGVVLVCGATARVGELTAVVSRKLQVTAARSLARAEIESSVPVDA